LAWQAKLAGYGQSSPVIIDRKVFVTSTAGNHKESFFVTALDLSSGGQLWEREFSNPTSEENSSYVSRAAPTPAVDASGVYALNEGGLLAALDHSGNLLWKRDLVAEFGEIKARHGLASSLEQDEQQLFVWIERSDDPYILSVDKKSGDTKWKVAGLGATTWGSPRLITVGQQQHLVCSASGRVVGLDPLQGHVLWELDNLANNTSSTPIPAGEGRFFLGASDGRGEEADPSNVSSNGLIQIAARPDGSFAAEFLWRADKATCSFGSPLIAAGKVWIVNRSGALYRLDLETGSQESVSRLEAGSIWASPLHDSQNVLLFGQQGTTSVVSITTGSEIGVNSLWESPTQKAGEPVVSSHIQYAAAASDGFLLIRRGDTLFAIH
jgi:outer membrane protein assembly factor BamB